jgi:DNA-directed RNA polymerase specialized sigma24 family protein
LADFAHLSAHGNGNKGKSGFAYADESESRDIVELVRRAISTLPASYREVVVLCELEEMSYEETATALGCPVGTVRSRLHRARAILIDKLREGRSASAAAVLGRRVGRQLL